MNGRSSLKSLLALALALQIPSQVSACRVGWDQHLFEESPPVDALAGVQIIRVRFSNARPAIDRFPRQAATADSSMLSYTLIGVARRFDEGVSGAESFPVYAFVTSCSGFFPESFGNMRTVVDGSYYLIGRFASDEGGPRFYAGGRHVRGGEKSYGGWHF